MLQYSSHEEGLYQKHSYNNYLVVCLLTMAKLVILQAITKCFFYFLSTRTTVVQHSWDKSGSSFNVNVSFVDALSLVFLCNVIEQKVIIVLIDFIKDFPFYIGFFR